MVFCSSGNSCFHHASSLPSSVLYAVISYKPSEWNCSSHSESFSAFNSAAQGFYAAHGFTMQTTITALARDGIRLPQAFCTTASCSASRSVILTGIHNHANAHYGHAHAYHHFSSYPKIQSLPVRMTEAGYCDPGPIRPPYDVFPADYAEASREAGRRWRQLRGEFAGGRASTAAEAVS